MNLNSVYRTRITENDSWAGSSTVNDVLSPDNFFSQLQVKLKLLLCQAQFPHEARLTLNSLCPEIGRVCVTPQSGDNEAVFAGDPQR